MWPVVDAKAQLSELLRRARAGSPQIIGTREPCVLVSQEAYLSQRPSDEHDGRWLVALAARVGAEIPEAPRGADRVPPPLGD